MKTNHFLLFFLTVLCSFFCGCELVEGIFKAGVWSGVLMVALVIGVIVFIIMKIGKGKS